MDIQDWSTTAVSNADIDGIDIAEHCDPANLNNALRALMANVAGLRNLLGGAATTAGSANAYILASGLSLAAYAQTIPIGFEANHTNSGAATLNVDGLGAKSIVTQTGGGLSAGQIAAGGVYLVAYEAGANSFKLIGGLDAAVMLLNGLSPAANKIPYYASGAAAALLDFKDEDDFASDSATAAPSQQSTKAYIAAQMSGAGLGDMLKSENLSGLANYATARGNMGLAVGTNVQAYSARLGEIAALAVADNNIIVGNGSAWVAESGVTARTSLGLSIGVDVQAYSAKLAAVAALSAADSQFVVGNGTTFVAESGSTVRTSLGLGSLATASSVNGGNWSGTDLAVADGGTGASDASGARTNLGLGSLATASSINNGNWSGTDLAVANGGTGASDAATARSNLGCAPIPTSSTLPVGYCGIMEYTNTGALANGSTTSGNNLNTPVVTLSEFATGSGAVQSGTWRNVSGVELDANGAFNAGLCVRES